jgi:protein phosphatase
MNLEQSDRTIALPDPSLVLLLGARGAGKTTFARRHFEPSEIVSLDECCRMLGVSPSAPSNDTLELFQTIIQNRLFSGKLVVVDMDDTNAELRRAVVTLSKRHHLFAIAIAFKLDERICIQRNAFRSDCVVSPYDVKRGVENVRRILDSSSREGLRDIHVLDSPEAVEKAIITRTKLWTDKRHDSGPFDIIGDVHGCADELEELLELLGYRVTWDAAVPHGVQVVPPEGRRVIFLGDLIDRGPRVVDSLRIAMSMVESGAALCVPGNHEVKFLRKLRGKTVSITHGLAETLAEFERMPQSFHDEVACFIDKLVGHYVLDGGRLCVVHAGIKENMQGRSSSAAREFGLYGDTSGETDEYGLPVRHEWATGYHGRAAVVYGHTPMLTAEWLNNTICIDTGCVFGGALTALRYPEREIISVPAKKRYFEPKKPLVARVSQAGPMSQRMAETSLSLDLLRAGGVLKTRFGQDVTIPEEPQVLAAIEMLSRFGVDPRWLVYIPPVTSPVDASARPGILEHPEQALAYYRKRDVAEIVCQETHEGLRVVVVVCRDVYAAQRHFRVQDGRLGIAYSRTGRSVFADRATEDAGLFTQHGPFIVFEASLSVPQVRTRPFPDEPAFVAAVDALTRTSARGVDIGSLVQRLQTRRERLSEHPHSAATTSSSSLQVTECRVVPWRVLATEETSWFTRRHGDHAAVFKRLEQADPELFATAKSVEMRLDDRESNARVFAAWDEWVAGGAEGMLVKPIVFQRCSRPGLTLPELVCRGATALRSVHGPEYDIGTNLERIRRRSLAALRARALSQFALGMEAVERFVEQEPSLRVHLCVSVAVALECQSLESTS